MGRSFRTASGWSTARSDAGVGRSGGLDPTDIFPHGHHKAKIPVDVARTRGGDDGRLVLVTGISPTPAGEGKSTVSVGLADALSLRGKNPVLCLREPSLGPVFGIKGGAAGFREVLVGKYDLVHA